jgi:cellulose synthase/poly-beta-1,6-N-acetylglucosamine synthase-like glycosyltransferase
MLYHLICILLLFLLFIYIIYVECTKETVINKLQLSEESERTKNELVKFKVPYCIAIPTYKPHFKYVEKLINSIDKYCKENINIYIIVSSDEMEDAKYFSELSSKISVTILSFKDIFNKTLNIDINEIEFLSSMSVYKFQSLKKIITTYYLVEFLKYEWVYVMDSEGLFIRPFSFINLI